MSSNSQHESEKQRVIMLKPGKELAALIDQAARGDRRSAPAWVLHQLETILKSGTAAAPVAPVVLFQTEGAKQEGSR